MKNFGEETCFVMDHWCTKLLCMRVISFAFTRELPDSIGNWKHLRYLEISGTCPLKRIPSTFCGLYDLQILYAKGCYLESLPSEFSKLISLQRFELNDLSYNAGRRMTFHAHQIRLMKNLNQFHGHLEIDNVDIQSNDHAVEAELKNKIFLDELKLKMRSFVGSPPESRIIHDKEVLQVLQPPTSLKSLLLQNYAGVSLPRWFQPQNLPILKSLTFVGCSELQSISSRMISQSIDLNEIPVVGIFHSLTDVAIDGCANISSLEHFLHPDYVPAIKKIRIEHCEMLESVPTEEFGEFHFLEELDVCDCPNIRLQRLFSPSLKKLHLWGVGLFCNIDCCSLTDFDLQCAFVTSIQLQMWSLPCLRQLRIKCKSLTSIGGSITTFSSLNVLIVQCCEKLSTLGGFLTHEYLPAIEKIDIEYCPKLLFLPVERFVSFPYLKHLVVIECPSLKWQRGFVLPSYLQTLTLQRCGDISPYVPSCLQNLTSLVSLSIGGCEGITSIQGNIWCSNLASLEVLVIQDCPNLVSVGGANAVAKIKQVLIIQCPNLKEAEQINRRPY